MTMSARGLPRRVVRDRRAQGDEVGERHHRHVPRAALAGHGVRAAAPLHGRDRRRLPRLGLREGRHRRDQRVDRRRGARASAPRSAPTPAVAQVLVKNGRATGVVLENGDEIRAPIVVSGLDPRRTFLELRRPRRSCPTEFVGDIERFKFRGSSGKVNLALGELPDFTCLPGARPAPPRRDLDQPEPRLPRARLRRREVRRVLARARTWTSSSPR